jgi:hypothetical protein
VKLWGIIIKISVYVVGKIKKKVMDKREDFKNSYYDKFNKLFNISEIEFMSYYDETKYGGYPEEPGGSIWESEGKSIYVLIRVLKPKRILEIGNYLGRSTNHILQAIEMNGFGIVDLVDIFDRLEYDKLHSKNFNRIIDDSLNFLNSELTYDLIIQDGCHEYEHVKTELDLILKNNNNGYVIWGHDYFSLIPNVCEVTKAYDELKSEFTGFEPMKDSVSNCGFIIVKK